MPCNDGGPSMGVNFLFYGKIVTVHVTQETQSMALLRLVFQMKNGLIYFPQMSLFSKFLPFDESILYWRNYQHRITHKHPTHSHSLLSFSVPSANTTIGMIQTYTVNLDILLVKQWLVEFQIPVCSFSPYPTTRKERCFISQ